MFRPRAIPPTNARLVRTDGTVLPLDCAYRGWDRDKKVHTWQTVTRVTVYHGDAFQVDALPPHTAIEFTLADFG